MNNKKEERRLSEKLSGVLKEVRDIKGLYSYSCDRVKELEQLQNDYLHKLELEKLTSKERNRVATALKNCRQERREHKNNIELLVKIIDFIEQYSSQFKQLERVLGDLRRIEDNQSKRSYKPRILTVEEYEAH